MKVRFLQSVTGTLIHYRQGSVVDIPADMATDFLNAGYCEAVAEAPKARAKKAVKKSTKKETR